MLRGRGSGGRSGSGTGGGAVKAALGPGRAAPVEAAALTVAVEPAAALAILKETHLLDIQNTRMGEASGGQKQRAYLAQALLDKPDFIILDEATASLDPVAKEELMSLIKHLNEKHAMTVLFTTHDIPLAKKYMKDYLLFKDKGLIAGKIKDLTEEVGEE